MVHRRTSCGHHPRSLVSPHARYGTAHHPSNFLILSTGVIIKAVWIEGQGCVIIHTNTTVLLATWIYTMTFDFIILTLTGAKLVQPNSRFRSKLVELVFKDGLIYFIVA